MAQEVIPVGVVIAKRRLKSAWAAYAWVPHAVLPAVVDLEPGTRLPSEGDDELYYAGPFELTLRSSETAHYRDNLASSRPALWVAIRPLAGDRHDVVAVTADPYEGEALTEGINEIVEPVPIPSVVRERISSFFSAHHVDRPFLKRVRDRADPEALARRGAVRARLDEGD